MTINPYESPIDAQFVETGNDAIRVKYLPHERAVKSISVLYYAGAIVLLLLFFLVLFSDGEIEVRAGISVCALLFAAGYFVLAQAVQQLRPWARIISTILALPGLCGFPVGTIISAFILYLLLSTKGKVVFSEEYAKVRAATPHLDKQIRTSPIVIFFAFLLLAVVGIAVIGALITYFAAENSV
jgi:hypothetical protein